MTVFLLGVLIGVAALTIEEIMDRDWRGAAVNVAVCVALVVAFVLVGGLE